MKGDENTSKLDNLLSLKEDQEDLIRYKMVNSCETLAELAKAIEYIADENGDIMGRTRPFSAEQQIVNCLNYKMLFSSGFANVLTRMYGIRQQAIYIITLGNDLEIKLSL